MKQDNRKSKTCFLFYFLAIAFFPAISLLLAFHAGAQQIEMSSSLNPVGSGARAMGMGGAFIGVADDATAASWNPAGLIHLEKPEVSVVYSLFRRKQAYNSAVHPEIGSSNSMDSNGINYASAAFPFVLFNRNMIVSLNYQRLFEMNKKVNFKYTWDVGGDKLYDNISFEQDGFLYTLSPAFAVQVRPEFYLGATLNFWGNYAGDNGWDSTYASSKAGTLAGNAFTERFSEKRNISFKGANAHLGFLWNIHGFTLGGVYKSPFNAKLKKETATLQVQDWPGLGVHTESAANTRENLIMKMPSSYGLGLSYRHSDSWSMAFDLYRTEWSRFLVRDQMGNEINPVDGTLISQGRLKDTTQVRAGTEYLFIKENRVVPLRFGVLYDPEPAKESLDDYYGFSLGTGFSTGKISLDAAYQYRTGRKISGDIAAVPGSSADINQHSLMMSVIYYF